MKHIYWIIVMVGITSCMPKDLPTVSYIKDHHIAVKLSHMTTLTDMQKIKEDLKTQNILMDYGPSEFFDDGKLRKLRLSVKTDNGISSGVTSADLTSLQYSYYGFEFFANGYFKIGKIE